jgi:hypothetical protein
LFVVSDSFGIGMSRTSLRKQVRTLPDPNLNNRDRPEYKRLQNRAAALRDYDIGVHDLWMIAHLHQITSNQILHDYDGNPEIISSSFDLTSTTEIERVLTNVLKEIRKGIHPELAAISHKLPFVLVKKVLDKCDIKNVVIQYIDDVTRKLGTIHQQTRGTEFSNIIVEHVSLEDFVSFSHACSF